MRKALLVIGFSAAIVLVAALPALAWKFTAAVSSHCDGETGHAIVVATYQNNAGKSVTVKVTEKATGHDQTQAVAVGDTATFTFDIGTSPQPAGEVRFDLTWTNGDEGTDSVTRSYEAIPECASPTPPPTSTTPPPTSTTPPPTTPPTTTPPPPTTHTRTTPPPTSTAHTGGDFGMPVGAFAVLLVGGLGATWFARRRMTD